MTIPMKSLKASTFFLLIWTCGCATQLQTVTHPITPKELSNKAYAVIQYQMLVSPVAHEWVFEDEEGEKYQLFVPTVINTQRGLVFEVPSGRSLHLRRVRFQRRYYNIEGLGIKVVSGQVQHLGFYRFSRRYGRWTPYRLARESLSPEVAQNWFKKFLDHYQVPPDQVAFERPPVWRSPMR